MNVELEIVVERPGLYEVTQQVSEIVSGSGVDEGLATIFIRHTSASLIIQENADPSVLEDLQAWMDRSVPQDAQLYAHRAEGPDDMPAHIRAAITTSSVTIPVMNGRMALGTWQGIFLWEHRNGPKQRHIIVSVH
ncbi:MAG: secondary thiamine-phosphate synthase enzyme YjbQ [Pseudomonadota bacterium]|nr:secondary thiamine-phosphate synthase enzyme YjbQ [Pseudomonadota bacterium]MEE3133894.1 secondary thiamine-phosphate synthase enzyme YjbQ [Pseudomonadota bacterium]